MDGFDRTGKQGASVLSISAEEEATTISGRGTMSNMRKTAIVTGASQGIGAGVVKAFVERGYNVVANSRKVTQSTEVAASDQVALVDGHIREPAIAAQIVTT